MKVFATLLLLAALFSCNRSREAQTDKPPNIILILTDDQGYGDIGIHGNPFIRTPVMDSLAALGTRIDPFYVCPVCAPTRSSLMTGRYHLRTGVYDTYNGGAMMATGEVTVAEVLSEHGYHTAMIGKWHLGDGYPMRPMDQGFNYYLAHKGGGIGQPGDDFGNFIRGDSSYFDPFLWENGVRVRKDGYCSDIFTDAAIQFIKEHQSGRGQAGGPDGDPFLLYLAFNAPHTPLQLPETYENEYSGLEYGPGDFSVAGENVTGMQPRDMADARRVYGMVSNIDDNLGRLWSALTEMGLEENTILVFITDNGPQQRRFTSGLNGRKSSVLEGGIRVPCIFYWKGGLEGNRVIHTPGAHIDIMPTLLEFAGIPHKGELDGVSLAPLLTGESGSLPERPLFFVWARGYPQKYTNMAVRKGPFKLVGNIDHGGSTDLFELFNLDEDPNERIDLSSVDQETVSGLKNELDRWYDKIIQSPNLLSPPRMVVGSARENPVILGRNDWKGPAAQRWNSPEAYGYWDITVAEPGSYTVRMVFRDPLESPGRATVRIGTRQYSAALPEQAGNEISLSGMTFDPGDHSFESWVQVSGKLLSPMYVEIEKQQIP